MAEFPVHPTSLNISKANRSLNLTLKKKIFPRSNPRKFLTHPPPLPLPTVNFTSASAIFKMQTVLEFLNLSHTEKCFHGKEEEEEEKKFEKKNRIEISLRVILSVLPILRKTKKFPKKKGKKENKILKQKF